MRTILNFLWFVLGGVLMGLAWWLAGMPTVSGSIGLVAVLVL